MILEGPGEGRCEERTFLAGILPDRRPDIALLALLTAGGSKETSEAETEVGALMAALALPWIPSEPAQHIIQP